MVLAVCGWGWWVYELAECAAAGYMWVYVLSENVPSVLSVCLRAGLEFGETTCLPPLFPLLPHLFGILLGHGEGAQASPLREAMRGDVM